MSINFDKLAEDHDRVNEHFNRSDTYAEEELDDIISQDDFLDKIQKALSLVSEWQNVSDQWKDRYQHNSGLLKTINWNQDDSARLGYFVACIEIDEGVILYKHFKTGRIIKVRAGDLLTKYTGDEPIVKLGQGDYAKKITG